MRRRRKWIAQTPVSSVNVGSDWIIRVKEAKDKLEAPYLFALVDGRKEKVGNFRAEPPGLFRGRGEHPKKGTLKVRLLVVSWRCRTHGRRNGCVRRISY
jgi:hypothetical protein